MSLFAFGCDVCDLAQRPSLVASRYLCLILKGSSPYAVYLGGDGDFLSLPFLPPSRLDVLIVLSQEKYTLCVLCVSFSFIDGPANNFRAFGYWQSSGKLCGTPCYLTGSSDKIGVQMFVAHGFLQDLRQIGTGCPISFELVSGRNFVDQALACRQRTK